MILHLLRKRRNVNRNVFNDRKNVSATAPCVIIFPRGILIVNCTLIRYPVVYAENETPCIAITARRVVTTAI